MKKRIIENVLAIVGMVILGVFVWLWLGNMITNFDANNPSMIPVGDIVRIGKTIIAYEGMVEKDLIINVTKVLRVSAIVLDVITIARCIIDMFEEDDEN